MLFVVTVLGLVGAGCMGNSSRKRVKERVSADGSRTTVYDVRNTTITTLSKTTVGAIQSTTTDVSTNAGSYSRVIGAEAIATRAESEKPINAARDLIRETKRP